MNSCTSIELARGIRRIGSLDGLARSVGAPDRFAL